MDNTAIMTVLEDFSVVKREEDEVFTSLPAGTEIERAFLFNTVMNTTDKLGDCTEVINMVHIYAENIEMTDEETGEIKRVVRTVIVDNAGKSYHSCSSGVFRSLKLILKGWGHPATWEKPLKVKQKLTQFGKKNVRTLEIVPDKK